MKIAIKLDFTQTHTKYLFVRYELSEFSTDTLIMTFPTWSPGSYMIRDFESQLEYLKIHGEDGKEIPFKKISKCQWQFAVKNTGKVFLNYQVYAHNLNVRQCYTDHEMAFLNTPAVCFFPEGFLQSPVSLQIKLPTSWKLALAATPNAKHEYRFPDFDAFYDTPILASKNLTVKNFKVKTTSYSMNFWGGYRGDLEKIVNDTKKIVTQQIALFGDHPSKRYGFQILFVKGQYGGLEHRDSSTNIYDGSKLEDPKDYRRFLALLSHEHFHLWNVKRIRPRALGPFDYTKENYTRELWIAEGVTSYYDDHFLLRAGIYTSEQYLSELTDNLNKSENQKANQVNSLADSSFDSWIRFYRPTENSLNTVVSYYLKGGLIMMLLDFEIIRLTSGKATLDDAMRDLYALYKERPHLGITAEEFWNSVEKITQKSFQSFVQDYIEGTKPVNWAAALEKFGLQLQDNKKTAPFFLGVILGRSNGKLVIQKITEDSPAYHSILQPFDEILALNGERFESEKDIDYYLTKPQLEVLFCRHNKIYQTKLTLAKNENFDKKIIPAKKLSALQKKFFEKFFRGHSDSGKKSS